MQGAGEAGGYGWTELHRKASAGLADDVRSIVASKADIDATDDMGRTALHWAAFRGHADVAAALLRAGADARIKDENTLSAEDIARARGFFHVAEIIRNSPRSAGQGR